MITSIITCIRNSITHDEHNKSEDWLMITEHKGKVKQKAFDEINDKLPKKLIKQMVCKCYEKNILELLTIYHSNPCKIKIKQNGNNFGMVILLNQMDVGSLIGSGMKKITSQFYVDKTKQLGRGNFGTVYKGYHLSTNQIIAVKFVKKEMLAKFPDYQRQIMVMHDLAKINHQNIMGYYGYEDNQDGLYCFIQFCNGGTLKDLIKSKISEMKVLTLFKQILDAMTYINDQNKVHRDLKPDNILLNENGQLKIADFGLARDVQAKMTKGVCTPLYAAPQVLCLDPYDAKCDVWSAGLILYEMLTGKQMFEHIKKKNDLMKEIAKFQSPNHKIPIPKQLSPEWQKLISKMLTHNAQKRLSFKEMKEYFNSIEQELREYLIKKYDQETPGLEAFQNQLRLTKSISPYASNPNKVVNKNSLADMAQKLKQEKSFTNMNNLRKWLNFSRQKAEIMVKLIKQFNNSQYGCVKNVHKYILMFLSVSCYISKMISYSNEIKSKKMSTPQGIITQDDIISTHINEWKQMLKQTTTKLDTSVSKYKGVLQKQIIVKIMGTYMKRADEEKIIVDCGNLLDLLKQAKQGNYVDSEVYMNMFKKLANGQGIHFSNNVIKQFKYQDLKVYTYIRVIACIDQVFLNSSYKNDDYLRSKKQQIENATKQQLIDIVVKFNSV